jgi:APA family basic amino acid/polyamine antiporter
LQGSGLESLIRFIVCLATLTSVWSIAIAGPRVYSQMAVDRLMPAWLMTRGGEPRLAIWVQAILAVVVVWFASLRDMLGYLGMTLSMCAALTVACVLLPNRGAEAERNQASAIAKVASAIYVLTTIGLIVLAASNRRYEMFAMVATVVVGIILMLVWKQVYPSEGISSTDSKRA